MSISTVVTYVKSSLALHSRAWGDTSVFVDFGVGDAIRTRLFDKVPYNKASTRLNASSQR
jgi:hypothetical protein